MPKSGDLLYNCKSKCLKLLHSWTSKQDKRFQVLLVRSTSGIQCNTIRFPGKSGLFRLPEVQGPTAFWDQILSYHHLSFSARIFLINFSCLSFRVRCGAPGHRPLAGRRFPDEGPRSGPEDLRSPRTGGSEDHSPNHVRKTRSASSQKRSERRQQVLAARGVGYPWPEQMTRKMLRNVEKRGVQAARKRSERGREVLTAH